MLEALITDLAGFTHFVASRQGLFVIGPDRCELLALGRWYGLTIQGSKLYAFNHLDKAELSTRQGRIVCFDMANGMACHVVAEGLDNGCHQIDFIDGRLHVVDTHGQRLIVVAEGGALTTLTPIRPVARNSPVPGYVHMNSLLARGDHIYLLLDHEGAQPSQLAVFDRHWQDQGRITLQGLGCYNIVMLEDGDMLYCASMDGWLRTTSGRVIEAVNGLMTRGLSVGIDQIAVGSSVFGKRAVRHGLPGVVSLMDRDYRVMHKVIIPGAPTEIRRIDGQDLSLSDYQGAIATACAA